MCSQVYHCTPSELQGQDFQTLMKHYIIFEESKKKEQKEVEEINRRKR
jgi:hypothetical protein